MSKLADRIEALDGRNAKGDMTILTAEIAKSLGWVRVTPSEARSKRGHWIAPEDCRDGKPVYCSLHGTTLHALPPNWLWSLDAAMTLVPEGWRVNIDISEDRISSVVLDGRETVAFTPALAVCAAAIRAKEPTP